MSYWKWLKVGLYGFCNVKEWSNFSKGIAMFVIGLFSTLFLAFYTTANIDMLLGLIIFIVGIFFTMTYSFYWMVKDF